jgi:protein-S-isoprenylcysteine O-methyltransferase Ste14
VLAVAGFVWAIRSIGSFDVFGTAALSRHLSGRSPRPADARESADASQIERSSPAFVIRGPYRHIRHPFYAFALVGIWSTAHVTSDRLLFNVVWTAWIVAATRWEERDLLAEFGAAYGASQARVPMLLPRLHRASAR